MKPTRCTKCNWFGDECIGQQLRCPMCGSEKLKEIEWSFYLTLLGLVIAKDQLPKVEAMHKRVVDEEAVARRYFEAFPDRATDFALTDQSRRLRKLVVNFEEELMDCGVL